MVTVPVIVSNISQLAQAVTLCSGLFYTILNEKTALSVSLTLSNHLWAQFKAVWSSNNHQAYKGLENYFLQLLLPLTPSQDVNKTAILRQTKAR